jgi:hypothetical protein
LSYDLTTVHNDQDFQYRSVSKATICCLVFTILGALFSWISPLFLLMPVLGIGFGMVALSSFRRFPDELIGKLGAKIGLFASLLMLIIGTGTHWYVYATEVPEGYQRISFADLKPPKRNPLPYGEKAKEIDGEKVFLKGYVRPSTKKKGLKKFIMVGDFGDCCFGGSPKITEIVAVDIRIPKTIDYGWGLRKIGGTFKLNPNTKPISEKDIPQVFYEIEADYVK